MLAGIAVSSPIAANASAYPATPDVITSDFTRAAEAGVKFTTNKATTITGVSFFKSDRNNASIVSIWDPTTNRRIATGLLTDNQATGWVTAQLSKQIVVDPGKTYIASYYSGRGGYSVNNNAYKSSVVDGNIVYPADAGVLSTNGKVPTDAPGVDGYAVHVLYEGQATTPAPEPTPEPTTPPVVTPEPTTPPVVTPEPTPAPEPTPEPTPAPEPTPEPVPAPDIAAAGSTTDSISLAWLSINVPTGAEYTVQYGTDESNLDHTATVDASTGNGITIWPLEESTKYYLNVYPTSNPSAAVNVSVLTKTNTTNPTPEPTKPVPADIPVSVAILGDSNSNGNNIDRTLEAGIRDKTAFVTQNRGYIEFVGGWANSGANSAFIAQNAPSVPNADVAVIMSGTNNIPVGVNKANLERDLQLTSKKVGAQKTLILAVPPFNKMNVESAALNVTLKEIADSNGWNFFDPWASIRTADNKWVAGYEGDGLHTNPAGYRVMGLALEQFIAKKYAGYDIPNQ